MNMGKWFGERFTDSVMDKWGEFFELDRNKVLKSFDNLKGYRKNLNKNTIEVESYLSAYFVPSLLLDDYFLVNIVNTVKDDKPYEPENWENAKSFKHIPPVVIDVDLNEPDVVWDVYIKSAVESTNALLRQASELDLLLGDINGIQFEFVQYILNNIGAVIYHCTNSLYFLMYIMVNMERCPEKLSDFVSREWPMKHFKPPVD